MPFVPKSVQAQQAAEKQSADSESAESGGDKMLGQFNEIMVLLKQLSEYDDEPTTLNLRDKPNPVTFKPIQLEEQEILSVKDFDEAVNNEEVSYEHSDVFDSIFS